MAQASLGDAAAGDDAQAAAAGGGQPGEGGGSACGAAAPEAPASEEDRLQQVRDDIEARTQAILARGPAYLAGRTLADFNGEGAAAQKAGEHAAAAATYSALFAKAKAANLTHPELYVCHSNCSAAYLALGLHAEALRHANACQQLAQASLRRNFKGSAAYVRSFLRKGRALLGLGCSRDAAAAFDAGLKLDPFSLELKQALQEANAAVLRDLAEGRARETRAIAYPEARQRISYHPYAAPLHKIKTDDMLPLRLLTPFQAESDHHVKDTYNYVTVQTDIRMPRRQLRQLEDAHFNGAFAAAIEAAAVAAGDRDVRVLNLGAGAGLHAMTALRAGAHHVTAVERWLYLALACKESLAANKASWLFPEDRCRVAYKRPTDLKLGPDVPICCNLLVANVLDEGLLTSGILPCVRHALGSLLTTDAVLLPASATVYMQAVELRTGDVCGLDMSAANLYRWHPAYAAGVPLAGERLVALSEPQEVWHFDMGAPPERSDVKSVDVAFTRRGRWNAVLFWYKLHLFGDIYLSTGPDGVAQGLRCLQPALQYIAGELPVDEGMVLPLVASHNTVRLRFDVESSEFLHLHKPDAAFPHAHFSMLADEGRCQAYARAIERAVAAARERDGEAHVLDVGCGTGILSLLAARAGAKSVVACDLHESLCDVARKAAAANGLSGAVSVVHRDAGLLQRGREVRALGANVVVADMFDSGLLGDGFPYLLELCRRRVVAPGAAVVPAGATLYCMGVEVATGSVSGFDLSGVNTYRWDASYETVSLADVPHRRLTRPARVTEQWFDGERKARGRDGLLRLEVVAEGTMNAVAFWFDLHLDDQETLTNAPDGIGEGGVVLCECLDAAEGPAAADSAGDAAAPADEEGEPAAAAAEEQQEAPDAATEVLPAAAAAASDAAAGQEASVAVAAGLEAAMAAADQAAAAQLRQAPAGQQASAAGPEGNAAAAGDDYQPAAAWEGARPGFAFKLGPLGQGYYLDRRPAAASSSGSSAAVGAEPEPGAAPPAATAPPPPPPAGTAPRHHWGQALQYLDRSAAVQPGRKVGLVVRREEGKLRFGLRQGVGEAVGRAPWKEEWGGGASVENPHFQRVHYCELLVRDFLQRVRCRRFPPIEKDMRMVLAHCGSLLLDPAALQEVYHELVVLEKLHQARDFSPAASLPALTKRPLRLC